MGYRTENFISQFLDYEVYKQKNLNPEFLRIKNNILLIILILSSCGIYYLFENFVDVMLLAFIGGTFYISIDRCWLSTNEIAIHQVLALWWALFSKINDYGCQNSLHFLSHIIDSVTTMDSGWIRIPLRLWQAFSPVRSYLCILFQG